MNYRFAALHNALFLLELQLVANYLLNLRSREPVVKAANNYCREVLLHLRQLHRIEIVPQHRPGLLYVRFVVQLVHHNKRLVGFKVHQQAALGLIMDHPVPSHKAFDWQSAKQLFETFQRCCV